MEYYAIKDQDGNVTKTSFIDKKETLEADDSKGEKVVKMKYDGCPHWENKQKLDDFLD